MHLSTPVCFIFLAWHKDLVLLELITCQTASKSCKLCSRNHERLSICQGAHRAPLPNEEWPSSTHNMFICNSVDCTQYCVKVNESYLQCLIFYSSGVKFCQTGFVTNLNLHWSWLNTIRF